jgi:hypothetical protein
MLLLFLPFTFLSSCIISDKYGRLSINLSKRTGITIEYLLEHWNDYEVFYAGVHEGVPSALTFDPKDDEKKLTFHEWWTRVKSKKQLKAQIISLIADRPEPVLWEILGPKNAIFGYMYTPYNSVYMRVVDQNTLWIDEMTIQLQNYRLYYFGGY